MPKVIIGKSVQNSSNGSESFQIILGTLEEFVRPNKNRFGDIRPRRKIYCGTKMLT